MTSISVQRPHGQDRVGGHLRGLPPRGRVEPAWRRSSSSSIPSYHLRPGRRSGAVSGLGELVESSRESDVFDESSVSVTEEEEPDEDDEGDDEDEGVGEGGGEGEGEGEGEDAADTTDCSSLGEGGGGGTSGVRTGAEALLLRAAPPWPVRTGGASPIPNPRWRAGGGS